VRLMVIKQHRGGYETLVREVSDSLHLRRFCRIALCERVPEESTIRKLVRRHARGDRQGRARAAVRGPRGTL
jgi:IS5 family transposase